MAADTTGTPLHLSVLRGNRADTSTLQGFLKILQRRFGIREAVFVFDAGMSSKINLEVIEGEGLNFVTRLSNATLEALLNDLPDEQQLELGDSNQHTAFVEKFESLHPLSFSQAPAKHLLTRPGRRG